MPALLFRGLPPLLALFVPTLLLAQFEDDEDFSPGLLARYSAGRRTVERVEPAVAFVWGADAPDPRLPAGPFGAEWTSLLLVRQEGRYTFHAHLQGEVTIEIDGRRVLAGRKSEPGWLSGEAVPLGFGEKAVRITFRKTEPTAEVRLFWSSDAFRLEPLPEHLLYRERTDRDDALSRIEQGRAMYDSARCNRCHLREDEPLAPPGPALTHLAGAIEPSALIEKLRQPQAGHGRMPSFGFTAEEAAAVAAFLLKDSQAPKLATFQVTDKDREKERRSGEVLFRSVGCLACHRVEGHGHDGPYGGGDLSAVGRKRPEAWLFTWLAQPEKLNADHQMPVFRLSEAERRQLALYLSGRGREEADGGEEGKHDRLSDGGIIAHGKRLVQAARCAACHQIPGAQADVTGIPALTRLDDEKWTNSCLAPAEKSPPLHKGGPGGVKQQPPTNNLSSTPQAHGPRPVGLRPAYQHLEREALIAFLNSRPETLSSEGRFAAGRRVLEQRNCLACHERGSSKGIGALAGKMAQVDATLTGQGPTLVPPPLNAVGDKLLDGYLADAVSGSQQETRLSWLRVRMPQFRHSADEKDALLAYFVGHDRIPDGAPHSELDGPPADADDPQTLVAGHLLVGVKGFSCIACHAVGSYQPRNVALGTRGSDLLALGQRMRPEFYLRWTRSPARILPGMEMPSYQRPVPGVLTGRLDTQLTAVWEGLNDPRFTPPTNPTAVEQYLVVRPGEPARIVRDVFTLPSTPPAYVARAFAVGLNSGHNVLYDLDTLSVRQWTFGDFARQRTQGKSWYWDMAGVPIVSASGPVSDFALRQPDGGLVRPKTEHGVNGRLLDYEQLSSDSTFPPLQGGAGGGKAESHSASNPPRPRLIKGGSKNGDRGSEGGVRFRYELNFEIDSRRHTLTVRETVTPLPADKQGRTGWQRRIEAAIVPTGYELSVAVHLPADAIGTPSVTRADDRDEWITDDRAFSPPSQGGAGGGNAESDRASNSPQPPLIKGGRKTTALQRDGDLHTAVLHYRAALRPDGLEMPVIETPPVPIERVTSVPGYDGVRLPLDRSIMPTALAWRPDGSLAFTSLKGHVWIARDTTGDGIEDALTLFEEGLAAPYGILADGDDLIVCHKPDVLRLRDTTGDGRADVREVFTTGWGYTDDYHDWTCGIVRDADGNLYVGLASDYPQNNRPRDKSRWRGKVLRISPQGEITPVAHSLRYPTGLAIDADDRIYISDQQGVQNTFNKINLLVEGAHYGVPSRYETDRDAPETPPVVQVPHPWTRSVNGIFFLPQAHGPRPVGLNEHPFAGHGIGCEYDTRFLVRFTMQQVGESLQGAVYPFSRPDAGAGESNFVGPLCGGVAPNGDIYIGGIHDSGWLGGRNTGEIVRLRPNGDLPAGIRELRATSEGFEIEFTGEIDPAAAARPESYTLSGYSRVWQGGYSTPDTGRHRAEVAAVEVLPAARTVRLRVPGLREGHVYEVTCGKIARDPQADLFPATGHYTLHGIPSSE